MIVFIEGRHSSRQVIFWNKVPLVLLDRELEFVWFYRFYVNRR